MTEQSLNRETTDVVREGVDLSAIARELDFTGHTHPRNVRPLIAAILSQLALEDAEDELAATQSRVPAYGYAGTREQLAHNAAGEAYDVALRHRTRVWSAFTSDGEAVVSEVVE